LSSAAAQAAALNSKRNQAVDRSVPALGPSTSLKCSGSGGLDAPKGIPCAVALDKNLSKCEHESHIRTEV
jgi:hypothetical protein